VGLSLLFLGVACAGTPATAPETPRVVALPMNVSGAVPPACRLPFGPDGARCSDTGAPVVLTDVQAAALTGVLEDPATWSGHEGKSTLPLHGFAWLDETGAVAGQIAVSLLTDKVEGAPAVPGQPADPAKRGLSEAGVLALRAVCVDIGLPHCHITTPGEAFGR
jgi:hypothetical protein